MATLSVKVIGNYTIQCGTHDFLLTFHSNHIGLSRPVSEINGDIRRKSLIFPPPCIKLPPMKGFPLEFGIGARGPECFYDGATRWSKKF